jgi:hypothetical protein
MLGAGGAEVKEGDDAVAREANGRAIPIRLASDVACRAEDPWLSLGMTAQKGTHGTGPGVYSRPPSYPQPSTAVDYLWKSDPEPGRGR